MLDSITRFIGELVVITVMFLAVLYFGGLL